MSRTDGLSVLKAGWSHIRSQTQALAWPTWPHPDRPEKEVLQWLWDMGEWAVKFCSTDPSEAELAKWVTDMAQLAVQPRVMNTARVFALCADLDIAAMRLQVPWGEEVNLEEWARMHLHVVAEWALQGMVDVGIRRRS